MIDLAQGAQDAQDAQGAPDLSPEVTRNVGTCPRCGQPTAQTGPFGGAVCGQCHRAEETQLLATFKRRHPYHRPPPLSPEGTP